ncbi:MAG: phosphoribosyltransferase [Fimbriimonas sp.]
MSIRFSNRGDAGRQLASALTHLRQRNPIVLGLVRGGLVLAAEIARELRCEMDVLVARKVGAPHHPEFGIGAVAPGGISVHNQQALHRLHLTRAEFEMLAQAEFREIERRLNAYRDAGQPLNVKGRTAIIVDDGLATGVTAKAACRYVRSLEPSHLVLAVPVCTRESQADLEQEVDEFVCLAQPEPFYSVGQWYDDFTQVEDQEVLDLLRLHKGYLA